VVYVTVTKHSGSHTALPTTLIGKWAGGLLLVFIVLLAWVIVGINFGGMERGSLLAAWAGGSMVFVGAATLVTGLLSQVKFKDRSWVIAVGMIVPALILIFVVVDLIVGG
jgi:hypothetical protein